MLHVLKKHWQVLIASWGEETEARKARKQYKEEEFLPAALEIMEKPPSPLGRIIVWAIVAFFTIAVIWAVFGRVDVVASAQGKAIPRAKVKIIQAPEAGMVRQIHVRDGMRVQQGDPLIDLDPTAANAEEAQAREQLAVASIDLARGEALLSFINEAQKPFNRDGLSEAIADRQEALIEAQIAEYKAQLSTLQKQYEERRADIAVVRSEMRKIRETLPMIREQVVAREALLAEGFSARLQVLEVRERQVSLEQDQQISRDELKKAQASLEAVNQQIDQLREEFRKVTLLELAEAEAQARLAQEELNKAARRRYLQSLTAPVDGVVQQLAIHTIGAVVQPADALLVVVPGAGELVIEAMVLNKDIGFVLEGDTVEVKLEAFPFTKYGVIPGKVENISRDAIQDENLGLIYHARVKLEKQTIEISGKEVRLSPGMAATAEIKTGKRRVIEYVLSPLLRYRDEALRER